MHTGRGGTDSPGIAAGRNAAATPGGRGRRPGRARPLSPPPLSPMLPHPERSEATTAAPLRQADATPHEAPGGAAAGAAGPPRHGGRGVGATDGATPHRATHGP